MNQSHSHHHPTIYLVDMIVAIIEVEARMKTIDQIMDYLQDWRYIWT